MLLLSFDLPCTLMFIPTCMITRLSCCSSIRMLTTAKVSQQRQKKPKVLLQGVLPSSVTGIFYLLRTLMFPSVLISGPLSAKGHSRHIVGFQIRKLTGSTSVGTRTHVLTHSLTYSLITPSEYVRTFGRLISMINYSNDSAYDLRSMILHSLNYKTITIKVVCEWKGVSICEYEYFF